MWNNFDFRLSSTTWQNLELSLKPIQRKQGLIRDNWKSQKYLTMFFKILPHFEDFYRKNLDARTPVSLALTNQWLINHF